VRLRPLSLVATLWRTTWRAGEGRGCVLCITASRLTTIDVIQSDAVCAKSTMKLRVTRSNSPSSCLSSGTARTCARPGPRPGPARTSLSCIENSDTNNSNIDRLRHHVVIPKWQRWHPLCLQKCWYIVTRKCQYWKYCVDNSGVRVYMLLFVLPPSTIPSLSSLKLVNTLSWSHDVMITLLRCLLLLPAKATPHLWGASAANCATGWW